MQKGKKENNENINKKNFVTQGYTNYYNGYSTNREIQEKYKTKTQ